MRQGPGQDQNHETRTVSGPEPQKRKTLGTHSAGPGLQQRPPVAAALHQCPAESSGVSSVQHTSHVH